MADQPPRRWAAADEDVLFEIVRRIPCETDRRHMSRVCHSWRVVLAKLKAPAPSPPLPWLVLPKADGPPTFSCVLSGCRSHPFFVPRGAAHRARYFGSYDGGWLFLGIGSQGQAQRHLLLKPNAFRLLDLPNTIHSPDMVYPPGVLGVVNRDREITIVAATLSCKPTEQGCIVAGLIDFVHSPGRAVREIAFWRMGDQVVLPPYWEQVANRPMMEVVLEDLIYHDGAFHFLIRMEHIIACEEPPVFEEEAVHLVPEYMYFQPRSGDNDETVLARYLVESREKLLMVVRFSSGRQHLPTSAFRVFQKEKINNGEEDEPLNNGAFQFQYYWSELDKLDGRMLFVGRGCSRSYEAGDRYPAGMEGVYFLDDRSFAESAMAFGDGADKLPYRCSDNGKWSGAPTDPRVDRCFPSRGPSIYSPPVWILP